MCSEHTGPPLLTTKSWTGDRICPVCTPLGSTFEATRNIVLRENAVMSNPYWSAGGPVT